MHPWPLMTFLIYIDLFDICLAVFGLLGLPFAIGVRLQVAIAPERLLVLIETVSITIGPGKTLVFLVELVLRHAIKFVTMKMCAFFVIIVVIFYSVMFLHMLIFMTVMFKSC